MMTSKPSIFSLLFFSALLSGFVSATFAEEGTLEKPEAEPQAEIQEDEPDVPELPENQFRKSVQDVFERIWVPSSRLTDGPQIRTLFRPVVEEARHATVHIRCNRSRVALGGIIGPDGWVVTKASRLEGPISCRLVDGRELDARLVGVDNELDLALLKLEAKQLPYFRLSEVPKEEDRQPTGTWIKRAEGTMDGDWIATVSVGLNPVAIGVVSVSPRDIRRRQGFLGVGYNASYEASESKGVKVDTVSPNSGAEKAGIEVGDIIVRIEDKPIDVMDDLREAISNRYPAEKVEVILLRGEDEVSVWAVLSDRDQLNPMSERSRYQNSLGSKLSVRRAGFPSALQHDTVLRPRDCGGPIVDIDGRLVGFNIARAGRTESYALPVDLVYSRIYDLMSGQMGL